jgi:hypothetical protein
MKMLFAALHESGRAPNGHADPIERCPLLGEQRKTSARSEHFAF